MYRKEIDEAIDHMKKAFDVLMDLRNTVEIKESQGTVSAQSMATIPVPTDNDFEFFTKAIKGDQWPVAANPASICRPDSEEDKLNRASGVVSLMIEDNLAGKKFLDFGCGEGHMAAEASNVAAYSTGYDITNQRWDHIPQKANLLLTSSWDAMKNHGPYNVILIFDVLDHANVDDGMDAPGVLLKRVVDELLLPNGKVYLRCHPWCSRHGTHIYTEVNKAFPHVVLTEEELLATGMNMGQKVHKVIAPLLTYRGWIAQSGLQIENERVIKVPIEPFFKTPKIAQRIIDNCALLEGGQYVYPDFQLSVSFVDYILRK